jgi:hypothetical protein
VDALVALPSGAVLALSEREANALLAAAAASVSSGAPALPPLLHHAYARDAAGAALLAPHAPLPHAAAAWLQLLNGEVFFGLGDDGNERTRAVAALLCSRAARAAALLLPPLRGAGHLVARSPLEELCEAGARSDDEEEDDALQSIMQE